MEQVNSQSTKREGLSKALLVCFIDRCFNLPVSKIKTRSFLFFILFDFSDRRKLVENQIHFVELKLKQEKQKLEHLKLKQIHNLNMYHKFYVQIQFRKN